MTDAIPPAGYDPATALEEVTRSTDRLLSSGRALSDAECRSPSRLPGWTRGHVLTHLARNADALRNLAEWAATGRETPMYASREARDADIEAGAGRPAADLLADLENASGRLREALAALPVDALQRPLRMGSGSAVAGWELPARRVREVEIHHVDLEAGYTPAHWAPEFAVRTLDELAELFRTQRDTPVTALHGTETDRTWLVGRAGPTLTGQESGLLAWLVGRSDGDGLTSEPHGPIPPAPAW